MANLNIKAQEEHTFDAIVVGTGISGGWAIKELTEKGLKVLALERGRDVKHGDYPTATLDPWEVPFDDELPEDEIKKNYYVQSRTGYTVQQTTKHWFVKDSEHPYKEKKRFDWMRGYHVGGRSITWGRQSYRWSKMDFEANLKEGIAVDWPIRYQDLDPWYSYVEKFIGVSGQSEGLPQLPDSVFQKPMDMNCTERFFKKNMEKEFPGRKMTIGRTAILTEPLNGRSACQYRRRCIRGCPYGAYFSSQSSTLPAAFETGNLALRPHSIVDSVIYDEETGKAKGVRIIDGETRETFEYFAKIIFLNASTVGSTFIMLNSKSDRFPNGLGNDSGELGHNLMDHHLGSGAYGVTDKFQDQYFFGRRNNGIYIPRFRNLSENDMPFLRGFGYQGSGSRMGIGRDTDQHFGEGHMNEVTKPGMWTFGINGFGECLPYHDNRMYLDETKKDPFGLPMIEFDAEFKENELKMREDMAASAAEMIEAAGFEEVTPYNNDPAIGLGIHEMGTARMGHDPKTSVLNKWNQVHAVPNVYVTDGSCMTSSACQNPSLTYMAITARAANHAVEKLKKK